MQWYFGKPQCVIVPVQKELWVSLWLNKSLGDIGPFETTVWVTIQEIVAIRGTLLTPIYNCDDNGSNYNKDNDNDNNDIDATNDKNDLKRKKY